MTKIIFNTFVGFGLKNLRKPQRLIKYLPSKLKIQRHAFGTKKFVSFPEQVTKVLLDWNTVEAA